VWTAGRLLVRRYAIVVAFHSYSNTSPTKRGQVVLPLTPSFLSASTHGIDGASPLGEGASWD
jgi:hypothetical protein